MAETTTSRAREATSQGQPGDGLKEAGQRLLGLLVQRAAQAATDRVDELVTRLDGVAENGLASLTARPEDSSGSEGGPGLGAKLGAGVSALKEKIKGVVGGGQDGSGKKLKVTNIVESIDVPLPLRTTYDLWTRYEDFPSFMKKLENVDRESDEKSQWKAQVFWSHRTWQATVIEQVPDSHIVWRSTGAKGHVDGGVSFTGIGPNLTQVLLVLEYWPQGLFERTGNLWRAQGRRARLEFKHFRRHAMTNVLLHPEKVEGWRGEIRDGEVVTTHEEALEQEQRAQGDEAGTEPTHEPEESAAQTEEPAEEPTEETGRADRRYEDEEAEEAEEAEDDYDEGYDEDHDYDESDDYDEDEDYTEDEDEDDEEQPRGDGRAAREDEPAPTRPRRSR
ncbi:SRPBCC family protein [Pseudonocardia hispaniensis]|uniref:SRPBCC family protein n=1 Tax=Pseudonocardia hispaniensis TaxID=904933 RepID=A0ABW1IY01_9PSEU